MKSTQRLSITEIQESINWSWGWTRDKVDNLASVHERSRQRYGICSFGSRGTESRAQSPLVSALEVAFDRNPRERFRDRSARSSRGFSTALSAASSISKEPSVAMRRRHLYPSCPNPMIIDALQRAEVMVRLSRDDRRLMLDAMKAAAVLRTDGVLDAKRRRHYGHAALLVACCVELEDARGKASSSAAWAVDLRARTARFPAFQRELHAMLSRVQRGTV
jgi:hypothetical protein